MAELAQFSRSRIHNFAAAVDKDSFTGEYSRDSVIVTLSVALALYNSLEMVLLILTTFRRWKGLYYWSLTICNWGVILYALGIMLGYFQLSVLWLNKTILDIGWVAMITCQSLVLYSRLGLILANPRILNAVKWMIVVDSIVLCTTVVVLDFGNTYSGRVSFSEGYYYVEQIQLTVFSLQELIISGLYVWKTLVLNDVFKDNTRTIMWQLFTINVIIISMDIALVTLQFLHFQLYQESLKCFVYSIKLKLELNILSKLVDLVNTNAATRSMSIGFIDPSAIVGQAQADLRREMSERGRPGDLKVQTPPDSPEKMDESLRSRPSVSGSSAHQVQDSEGISRLMSNQSRYTARTAGRESDIMYADLLRSMK